MTLVSVGQEGNVLSQEEPGCPGWAASQKQFVITITYPDPPSPSPPAFGALRPDALQPAHLPWVPGGGSGSHCAPPAGSQGSHSLRYLVTTTAPRTRLRDLQVSVVSYVDDTQILRFDSDVVTKMEALVPWAKQMGHDYWKQMRNGLEGYANTARENLKFAIRIYNQSDDGE